jgi:myo-inositol 2-dehydrogenase/D-chiro-inositol 1-dehydrogenase
MDQERCGDAFNSLVQVQMNQKIQLVVIGAGLIGPRHAQHVHERPDCELFAIIDHSAKGPGVASQFNTLLFRSVDEMLDFCDERGLRVPDGAIVATPNHTHVPIGSKLAARGIHMLMEKPLAPTVADCKALIAQCRYLGVHLLVGHHRRFNPYIISAKQNMDKVGRPVAIQGTWALKKPDTYFSEKPWRSSIELGGGTMLINLIHDIDLLQYLLGPVVKVYSELLIKQRAGNHSENAVDEGAVLTLRFANGCCGTFVCADNVISPYSFESGTGENPTVPHSENAAGFYRLFGSDGTLSIPDFTLHHQNNLPYEKRHWLNPVSSEKLDLSYQSLQDFDGGGAQMNYGLPTPSASPNDKDSPIHHIGQKQPVPFELQLEHFVDLITGRESEVKCTGEDAMRALLCVDAILESSRTGMPQYVPDIDLR